MKLTASGAPKTNDEIRAKQNFAADPERCARRKAGEAFAQTAIKLKNKTASMADINTTIMTGRLTRDPVIKNNGTPMGHFTLASNDRYRDKTGAVQTKTAFVFCKVYGAWAEALANRKKGDMVIVTGKLRSETWGDEVSQQQLVLVCNLIQFITISPKPASDPSANTLGLEFESGSAAPVSASTADADGKVPF